jgi:hypothetical protein
MVESENSIIEIEEDEDEEQVTRLIKTLYSLEITVNGTKEAVHLLLLAEKYMFVHVTNTLAKYLQHNMDNETLFTCMFEYYNDNETIAQAVDHYITTSGTKILANNDFLHLEYPQFQVVVSMFVNYSNGLQGLDAVHKWIDFNHETRAQHCYELTGLVNKASKVIKLTTPSFMTIPMKGNSVKVRVNFSESEAMSIGIISEAVKGTTQELESAYMITSPSSLHRVRGMVDHWEDGDVFEIEYNNGTIMIREIVRNSISVQGKVDSLSQNIFDLEYPEMYLYLRGTACTFTIIETVPIKQTINFQSPNSIDLDQVCDFRPIALRSDYPFSGF